MQKLIFVLLILGGGLGYAAQTRIKIGSSSWGYQIEQGPNIRTEFASEDGVASGFYQFKVGNETKKLEYRIDPNSREPDISFNVVNVDVDTSPQPPSPPPTSSDNNGDKEETTTTTTADPSNNNSTTTTNSPTTSSNNSTSSNEVVMSNSRSSSAVSSSNMTFDSIDSKQDFKGHVTLKVGNSTYTINFVTGDRAHTREETLLPSGMMFGRLSYLLQRGGSGGGGSPNKLVINYKFNSTSPDPTFEVSLYKTIESEPPLSSSGGSSGSSSSSHYQPPAATPREGYSRQVSYPARDRYNSIHHSPVSSSASSGVPGLSNSGSAIPSVRSQQQHYAALAEKYRERVQASQSGGGVVPPNWYYNRGKPVIYDP